MKSLSR